MRIIIPVILTIVTYSCRGNDLPKPSMEKELNVGEFLFLDTIGDSVFLNLEKGRKAFKEKTRDNKIIISNDSGIVTNGKNYNEFLKSFQKNKSLLPNTNYLNHENNLHRKKL